ncbi:hypothetical protein BJX63DRAFT_1510 [Aspergillus granulosus]|uniref:Uncharacterized protein n=1 Tax=Aspergillus granulosus TaxID=176169 RepID=A0ABR4I584_9EURO
MMNSLTFLQNTRIRVFQNGLAKKKSAIVKAGLNKACTRIHPIYFDQLRNHTNAVEQSHQKSYTLGMYLTLVQAVKNSANLDMDDILHYKDFLQANVNHSYRTSNMEANYARQPQQERGRKRQRSTGPGSGDRDERQMIQSSSRHSPCDRDGENESIRSSRSLQQEASSYHLSLELEIRREELRIEKLEADIRMREQEIWAKRIENDRFELELIERRMRLEKEQERVWKKISDKQDCYQSFYQ